MLYKASQSSPNLDYILWDLNKLALDTTAALVYQEIHYYIHL